MKITTYKTYAQADQSLDKFYYQNAMAFYGLYDQLQSVAENFQKRLATATKEQRTVLIEDLQAALSNLGKGERVIAPFRLYNCNHGYGFEVSYLNRGADATEGFFSSLDDLAHAVRDQAIRPPLSPYGITETLFLYTVTEPHHFSDEEKQKARTAQDYQHLTPDKQNDLDTRLEAYVEYGLGPEERQEFEQKYLQFFN